jgi:hypothetical protein
MEIRGRWAPFEAVGVYEAPPPAEVTNQWPRSRGLFKRHRQRRAPDRAPHASTGRGLHAGGG